MATHILNGSFGPGKTLRVSGRVNRRAGENRGLEARVAKLEATTEHIQSDVADLKSEVRGLRTELKTEVTNLRTELRTEVTGLRADLTNLRAEGRADFRLLFGTMLTMSLAIISMLIKIFGLI